MANFWIFPTTADDFELVKTHNVYALISQVDRDKIKADDKGIFYVIGSDPPVFVGVCHIIGHWEKTTEPFWVDEKAEGRVKYPWRFKLITLRTGAVNVHKLSKELSFIENKDAWPPYFLGSLGHFGWPIPESDYLLIFDEFLKPPVSYQVKIPAKPKEPPTTEVPKRRRFSQLPKNYRPYARTLARLLILNMVEWLSLPPSHNELRDMIRDIGLMKKLVSETEYRINDLRLDVAWRTEVQKTPSHVWEVHIAGNFYEALVKLKHAWDYWRAEPFLVTTEKFEAEARSLLGGTFHEIKPYIRIIHWKDILRLYKPLREVTDIEKKLRL